LSGTRRLGKIAHYGFLCRRLVLEPAMEIRRWSSSPIERPRRPAFRHFPALPRIAQAKAVQADSREQLKQLLAVASGAWSSLQSRSSSRRTETRGIHCSPPAQHRRHRRRSTPQPVRLIDGFAKHMRDALPNASFIGFTGTPIEKADANTRPCSATTFRSTTSSAQWRTRQRFDLLRKPPRQAGVKAIERPKIDPDFEEATEARKRR